jgi:uncharacterized protein (TIGR00106 family)
MPMFEVSIVPVGVEGPSISRHVKVAIEEIRASGLQFQLSPMGTCIIASYAQLAPVLEKIHRRFREMGVMRVTTTIKVDDRFDKELTFEGKMRAVTG